MKILSFNTGYFLDYEGTHLDYVKRPWKSVLGTGMEKQNLEEFVDLVEEEDPDFILTQEVDGGSIRTSTGGQHLYLKRALPDCYSCEFHTKYRGTVFPRLPLFRHMGNAVFYREGKAENHELDIGRKSLVQEIKMDGFSIFSLHLATFGGWIRKRQLKQVKQVLDERQDYVLAGDLNFHKGRKEIENLEEILGNKVRSPGKTFPARNPHQRLDLVSASEDIEIKNLRELGNRFSDHRPITFEIEKGWRSQ